MTFPLSAKQYRNSLKRRKLRPIHWRLLNRLGSSEDLCKGCIYRAKSTGNEPGEKASYVAQPPPNIALSITNTGNYERFILLKCLGLDDYLHNLISLPNIIVCKLSKNLLLDHQVYIIKILRLIIDKGRQTGPNAMTGPD